MILNDICLVIIFYNGSADIISHVKEFSTYLDTIYIINNNSTNCDIILKKIKKIKNVVVVDNNQNYGVSFALNQGLEFANQNHKKYMLTMDQDSDISKASVVNMLNFIKENQQVASVGPYYGTKLDKGTKLTKQVNYLITSGNLVNVENAIQVGGYTNKLFIDGVDIDFSFKLLANGLTIFKVGNAFMYHKIGEYEKSNLFDIKYLSHKPLRYYYMFRNNIYIYKRFFLLLPLQCTKLFLSLCWGFVKLIFIEINKKEKLKMAINGIWDGVTNANF